MEANSLNGKMNDRKNGTQDRNKITNLSLKSTNMNQKKDDKALAARKIFIGGLTSNTAKDNLIEYFSKFGGVEDANIKMDQNTGRSKGYGFVLFESKEIAEQVLAMSEHKIMGKTVDVKTAKYKGPAPIKKIFIGGLDPNVPETEIREYFGKFGKIEELELPFDKQKNQRRAFCFISFESEETVNEVTKKPKHILGGKEVDVKKAAPPKDQNQQNASLQTQWNQIQNWSSGLAPNSYMGQSTQGYSASNGMGLYNAPNAAYNAGNSGNYGQSNVGAGSYNYQGSNYNAYGVNYGENMDANYNEYNYDSEYYNYANAGSYDQTGYYQAGAAAAGVGNGSYDYYDQASYNYNNPAAAYSNPTAANPTKSSNAYGKSSSKRNPQSQASYHPYHR